MLQSRGTLQRSNRDSLLIFKLQPLHCRIHDNHSKTCVHPILQSRDLRSRRRRVTKPWSRFLHRGGSFLNSNSRHSTAGRPSIKGFALRSFHHLPKNTNSVSSREQNHDIVTYISSWWMALSLLFHSLLEHFELRLRDGLCCWGSGRNTSKSEHPISTNEGYVPPDAILIRRVNMTKMSLHLNISKNIITSNENILYVVGK